MPINPATLTTETAGRDGRTRVTRIPTARANVYVYVTTSHKGRPGYDGALGNAYLTTMNLVTEVNDHGLMVHEFAPAEAVGVLTTHDVRRYSERTANAHHALALDVVAAMSDLTRSNPAPHQVSRAQHRAGERALSAWLTSRVAA